MLKSELEIFVDNAAQKIKEKERKKRKKRKEGSTSKFKVFDRKTHYLMHNEETLSEEELNTRLNEGKEAILFIATAHSDRQWSRRNAISERNVTERELLRLTIKAQVFAETVNHYY